VGPDPGGRPGGPDGSEPSHDPFTMKNERCGTLGTGPGSGTMTASCHDIPMKGFHHLWTQ
jgi:hypothetical protein